jgi:hypothetical protein
MKEAEREILSSFWKVLELVRGSLTELYQEVVVEAKRGKAS